MKHTNIGSDVDAYVYLYEKVTGVVEVKVRDYSYAELMKLGGIGIDRVKWSSLISYKRNGYRVGLLLGCTDGYYICSINGLSKEDVQAGKLSRKDRADKPEYVDRPAIFITNEEKWSKI